MMTNIDIDRIKLRLLYVFDFLFLSFHRLIDYKMSITFGVFFSYFSLNTLNDNARLTSDYQKMGFVNRLRIKTIFIYVKICFLDVIHY